MSPKRILFSRPNSLPHLPFTSEKAILMMEYSPIVFVLSTICQFPSGEFGCDALVPDISVLR